MTTIVVNSACGRINFDPHVDASGDAAVPRCDIAAPFTSIQPVASLNSSVLDGAARLTDDELTVFFHSSRPAGLQTQLWTAQRASRELPGLLPRSEPDVLHECNLQRDERRRDHLVIRADPSTDGNVQPEKIAILGTIPASGPASGVLTTALAFPDQGLGVASAQCFLQTFRVSPIDGIALGSFAALTVLDSAY